MEKMHFLCSINLASFASMSGTKMLMIEYYESTSSFSQPEFTKLGRSIPFIINQKGTESRARFVNRLLESEFQSVKFLTIYP
jgi:hypothetical protein